MLDEGNVPNLETPEVPPPEESNNRTFLIVGGILAALIFLTLVCGAVYALWYLPSRTAQQKSTQAAILAGNAQVVAQMTSTAQAALWTPTSLPTDTPTNTPLSTNVPANSPTSVIAAVSTDTATMTPTTDPATLSAMQTQLAQQMTSTALALGRMVTPAVGPGPLPQTGFFDQVGLPTLLILTLALIVVIFLARRLRKAPTK